MPWIPEFIPAAQRVRAESWFRYEDVSQDGRVLLLAVPAAFGVLWQQLLARDPMAPRLMSHGVLPILSRIVIEGGQGGIDGGDGPVGVNQPVSVEGAFGLAHDVDERGEVSRIYLLQWVTLTAPIGRTHGPQPDDAGRPVVVGRALSEAVFTRPFGPLAERKVLRLELPDGEALPGIPPVPPARHRTAPASSLLELPPGARWLDDALLPDPATLQLGLAHTDGNQHVNSLVYPRWFEDAALRRLAAHERSTYVLGRRLDITYRKPSFVGDALRTRLRAYEAPRESGMSAGAAGELYVEGEERARCTLRMEFA